MKFDIKIYKSIFLVGIKGVGMAALAEMLSKSGVLVFGSDVEEDFITKCALDKVGIKIFKFGEKDLSEFDVIVRSNAYSEENNEDIRRAKEEGKEIFSYPDVVASLFNQNFGLAVAGSHGKTTTTAMLADVLLKAGKNTNAIVGSLVNEWQSGAKVGDIKKEEALFVLEADEYKKAFLNYFPKGAIITSIDYDHPDCYKTEEEYKEAFSNFINNISEDGFLVANKDDGNIDEITKSAKCKVIFYGKDKIVDIKLKIPGKHNIYNANAAYLAALELGVSEGDTKKYLEEFKGTARRFEILGEKEKAVIVDDYAHHPSEIRATILGVKDMFPDKKIVAIFQPHTYSRTKRFSKEFSEAFELADNVILTDIYYSAREKIDISVNMQDLAEHVGKKAVFIKEKENVFKNAKGYLSENTVILFMGAGDIWQTARRLYDAKE